MSVRIRSTWTYSFQSTPQGGTKLRPLEGDECRERPRMAVATDPASQFMDALGSVVGPAGCNPVAFRLVGSIPSVSTKQSFGQVA